MARRKKASGGWGIVAGLGVALAAWYLWAKPAAHGTSSGTGSPTVLSPAPAGSEVQAPDPFKMPPDAFGSMPDIFGGFVPAVPTLAGSGQ